MTDTTLITCAAGSVGRKVVNILEAQGKRVRAGVHRIERAPQVNEQFTDIVPLDFSDSRSIETAVTGVKQVCLITPHTNKQVEWASLLIDKAKEAGVKRIVRLSGLAAAMGPEVQVGRWMKHGRKLSGGVRAGVDGHSAQPVHAELLKPVSQGRQALLAAHRRWPNLPHRRWGCGRNSGEGANWGRTQQKNLYDHGQPAALYDGGDGDPGSG